MRQEIERITSVKELPEINVGNTVGGCLTPDEFSHLARVADALWLHSGDPKDPHAELTSGKCSNGFVDTLRLLRFTNICEMAAESLVEQVIQKHSGFDGVDWVVGSDHAGAAFSHAVAAWMGAQHDFTEKGPGKSQEWNRFAIQPDEVVLQVEELITTTGTLQAVRSGIRQGTPTPVQFVPFVATLVHRSKSYEFEGNPILYFVHYDIEVWEPSECPLCAAGSERLRPKQNWRELTAGRQMGLGL